MRYKPGKNVREIVSHYYVVKGDPAIPKVRQYLAPHLDMLLIFNFGKPATLLLDGQEKEVEDVVLIGPLRKVLAYDIDAHTDMIAVVFNPNGFYRLFQVPVHELDGEMIHHPDKLLGINGFRELWQEVKSVQPVTERIRMLEAAAESFIAHPEREALALTEGLRYLTNPAFQAGKVLADEQERSNRTIQLRFRKYTGSSSKALSRYVRFRKVIDFLINEQPAIDWLAIVDRFGYHDQSHLTKDFRYYLDTTPGHFVKQHLHSNFCTPKTDLF